uniref:Cyclic GMP-AMP synthase-like isoform X3 n=1 Tax=Geotrypetes seraphini TaxID=260995 RepID=A0A6P8Q882_GEOSA|nr:cyclic GMP-AMP synthase-like isoform X3 [Geotrypetes seraphini]
MITHDAFSPFAIVCTSWEEEIQILKDNEFNIMLKISSLPRVQCNELECSERDVYSVKLKRESNSRDLNIFLSENENLSSSKMLSELKEVMEKIIAKQKMHVAVEMKISGSPAITLQSKEHDPQITVNVILALEVKQSWPLATKDGLCIKHWLGNKVRGSFRFKSFYLVPGPTKETWCLSFPHIEKEMLNNHGKLKTCCELNGPKCCRKACLRLLQYLLQKLQHKNERNQKLVKFSSYHVKTAYFHACVSRPDDTNWKLEDLDNCFEILVNDFVNHLQIKELLHFFIPSMNLFGLFDQSSLTFLSDEIEYQRNNGFPIFIP